MTTIKALKKAHELAKKIPGEKINGKPVMFVSFSGGRTSGFMCKWLIDNLGHIFHFIFTFANTGQEHEETLIFVDKCDKAFGLDLTWVEAVVHHGERKGSTHKVVNFDTASRNGEPFEEVIKKYGIPNPDFQPCNRELKVNAMASYKRSLGFHGNHCACVGLRSDEMDRMDISASDSGRLAYPFISWNPITIDDRTAWWNRQSFGLGIPDALGNCVVCWKKSDRKLFKIAKDEPSRFDFFDRMEREHGLAGAQYFKPIMEEYTPDPIDVPGSSDFELSGYYEDGSDHEDYYGDEDGLVGRLPDPYFRQVGIEKDPTPRVFFRGHRSVGDIIASSLDHYSGDADSQTGFNFGLDREAACSVGCDL